MLKHTKRQVKTPSLLFFKHCGSNLRNCVIFLIKSFEILILLHSLRGERYRVSKIFVDIHKKVSSSFRMIDRKRDRRRLRAKLFWQSQSWRKWQKISIVKRRQNSWANALKNTRISAKIIRQMKIIFQKKHPFLEIQGWMINLFLF